MINLFDLFLNARYNLYEHVLECDAKKGRMKHISIRVLAEGLVYVWGENCLTF